MKFRLVALASSFILLSGCASLGWDGAPARIGAQDPATASPPATGPIVTTIVTGPVEQTGIPAHWCQKVAGINKDEAARDGFDAASQHGRAATLYRECREISELAEPPQGTAQAYAAAGR